MGGTPKLSKIFHQVRIETYGDSGIPPMLWNHDESPSCAALSTAPIILSSSS